MAVSTERSILRCDPTLEGSVSWPAGVNTLADLFRFQADSRSSATLFSFQSSPGSLRTLTYGQAQSDSLRLARSLTACFNASGTSSSRRPVCGIWFEKSLELHLSMLGVIQSGATWLGFDPDAPTSRVSACLEDSDAAVLICDEKHHERAVEAAAEARGGRVLVKTWSELMAEPDDSSRSVSPPSPSDPAYMIYTSGSTGTPKGIIIPHSAAVTFALSERSVLETGPRDIVWQGFSPAFDMFIEEVWVSIAGGAHLAVGTRAECQNGPSLGGVNGVWAKRGVTVVNAVPTLIGIMTSLEANATVIPPSVRLLNVGGEACPPALVERIWRPSLSIINTYGPSETTVTATFDRLFPNKAVTIGTPLPYYHAILLAIDEDEDPNSVTSPATLDLSPDVEGELSIGGPCLGLGYVNRDQLTRSKFIDHPLHPGEKLYRTGDRVRLGNDGKLHFLGRIDAQIKHRGFRIELGEIENVLASSSIVKNAAVICTNQGTEEARLEAFVVCTQPKNMLNISASLVILRSALTGLPTYMHPEEYTFLDANEMPRLPSGKINVKALHVMAAERAHAEEEINAEISKKTTDFDEDDVEADTILHIIMSELARMFPQLSKTGALKPSSDFFLDLGGHSLTAAILVSRLRTRGQGTALEGIGLQQVYEFKTAAAICQSLAQEAAPFELQYNDQASSSDISSEHSSTEIPTRRYVLCALAQIPALLFFAFIYGLNILAPYIVFVRVHRSRGADTGWAILATYGVFVALPWVLALIGVIGVRICLPRVKPGKYKLFGAFYFRWWMAKKFLDLIDQTTVGDTPLYPTLLRLLGAKIGKHCHISALPSGPALGMLTIGDDTIIGKDVMLGYETLVPGYLQLDPILIENEVNVGSRSVIEGGAVLESASELELLTMVPSGTRIPKATRWAGSPAKFVRMASDPYQGKATRPSAPRFYAFAFALWFLGTFVVPILYFAPQLPSILLFVVLNLWRHPTGHHHDHTGAWKQSALMSLPASLAYLICVFGELVLFKFIILGKVGPGKHRLASFFMVRKWLVDRLMDMSLVVLHPIYASLYVVPFLRALGVKIGHRAEVSNAQGLNFDLLDIGDETFIADGVLLGQGTVHANEITLERTKLEPRAFAGNASVIPQGSVLPSDSLVGVLSIPPQPGNGQRLEAGKSCFGSPPVVMASRQAPATQYADNLLFKPFKKQIATRLFIEFVRLWLPRLLVILAIAITLRFWETTEYHRHVGPGLAILLFPVFYIFLFCMPALIITLVLKWVLVGEYRNDEWPLWSLKVWLSEMVTSIYESLLTPLFMQLFLGTPYGAMILRLFGTTVGSKCTLLSYDITEFDMVTIGDGAIMNLHSGPQTHLFEDRIMKIGQVVLGDGAVLKPYSICLPGSMVGQGSTVGSLSLVMKGETVPAGQVWEGAPIRRRMPKGKGPVRK